MLKAFASEGCFCNPIIEYFYDCYVTNIVFFCYRPSRDAIPLVEKNIFYVIVRIFNFVMSQPALESVLTDAIFHVFAMVGAKKMKWIYAYSVVAFMADTKTVGNGSYEMFI